MKRTVKHNIINHLQNMNSLKQKQSNDRNRPLTHAELIHALTFLQSSSVIDSQEYTRLYTKALPFTKG